MTILFKQSSTLYYTVRIFINMDYYCSFFLFWDLPESKCNLSWEEYILHLFIDKLCVYKLYLLPTYMKRTEKKLLKHGCKSIKNIISTLLVVFTATKMCITFYFFLFQFFTVSNYLFSRKSKS